MNKNGKHQRNGKRAAIPLFVAQAERALHRAARKMRAENRRLGLPVIVWKNGKTVAVPA